MKNESDNRLKDSEFDKIEKEAIEDWKSNHKLDAIRTLRSEKGMSMKEAEIWLRQHA